MTITELYNQFSKSSKWRLLASVCRKRVRDIVLCNHGDEDADTLTRERLHQILEGSRRQSSDTVPVASCISHMMVWSGRWEDEANQLTQVVDAPIPGCKAFTKGTIYRDTGSKGYSLSGKRLFKNCWRAEITIAGQRYRHRSSDRQDCEDWLKAVRSGRVKPTDNKADWLRMEQHRDMEVRYDETIVSAAEETFLLYEYHQSGDLTNISKYMVERLLPHMTYYCCHTLQLGLQTSMNFTKQASALLLTQITAGRPVLSFTRTMKKMLRLRKGHRDFWYYEKPPEEVEMIVNGIDYSQLAQVWKVTKEKRF